MTVENISRSISTKECCPPRRGLNPRPPRSPVGQHIQLSHRSKLIKSVRCVDITNQKTQVLIYAYVTNADPVWLSMYITLKIFHEQSPGKNVADSAKVEPTNC